MDAHFDQEALIEAKAASRAADEAEIVSGRASSDEVNRRNGLAQKLDMRRSWVRLRSEME